MITTANRKIEALTPEMQVRVKKWLELCKQAKLDVLITETARSKARQFWLYCKGRVVTPAMEIKYLGYDDPSIASDPGAKQVTWTLASKHLEGKAIDFCFLKNGKAVWEGQWDKAYDIAETVGLVSLYRKTGVDRPHLEFNNLYDPTIQAKAFQIKALEDEYNQKASVANRAVEDLNLTRQKLADIKNVPYTPHFIK